MSSNIFWTCSTCGAQLPAEKVECPRCKKKEAKEAKAQAKAQRKAASQTQRKKPPVTARPKQQGSFDRHPELYEWEAKREAAGRDRMRTAAGAALLMGVLFAGLVYLLTDQAYPQARIATTAVAGALIGLAVYRWAHDSGFQMAVEAQRALVAIETEENTRETAQLLRERKPEESPPPNPEEPSQSADG